VSLDKDGPVEAVSRGITPDSKASGFAALAEFNRLDPTGEAIALSGPWKLCSIPKCWTRRESG